MPAYESNSFEPPAPVAQVTVRHPDSGHSVANVRMLIDSGADVTLLPRLSIADLLDPACKSPQYELEGFDGTRSLAAAVRLESHFLQRVFRGQFLLIEQEYGILGRNVLNAIPLLLDGPQLRWDERR